MYLILEFVFLQTLYTHRTAFYNKVDKNQTKTLNIIFTKKRI